MSKPRKKDYPFNDTRIDRWAVKAGKWGAFLFDKENNMPVDLYSIVERLNRLELRTRQLRWYVDIYGEVKLSKSKGDKP